MSEIIYLYGFVPEPSAAPPPDLHGVAGTAVELLPLGPVQAVFSRLSAERYGPNEIAAGMEDMAWVGEHGLAHERVVLWHVDQSEILPARLFTLYSDTSALAAAASSQAVRIRQQLDALQGRREWNLKVAYDRSELEQHGGEYSEAVRALDAELSAAPPGRRYLLERRRNETLKRELNAVARHLARELFDRLAASADAVRALPLASADAAGTVVLNGALLVPRTGEAEWRDGAEAEIERYRRLGMIVTLSGPWAPYRFLEADDPT